MRYIYSSSAPRQSEVINMCLLMLDMLTAAVCPPGPLYVCYVWGYTVSSVYHITVITHGNFSTHFALLENGCKRYIDLLYFYNLGKMKTMCLKEGREMVYNGKNMRCKVSEIGWE